MISTVGMQTNMALKLVDKTFDRQLDNLRSQPEHARAISAFKERIGKVNTVDDLIKDQTLYTFVMKAFDLEDQIFGKGLMRRALESDIDDRKSLINRLTDPRIREMHKEMGFRDGGTINTKTFSRKWQDEMVDRYVERQVINGHWSTNEGVGAVLESRKKLAKVETWFDVFKDKQLYEFMRTALGMPDDIVKMDIDRKAAIFERKFAIENLKDPKELAKLERQFTSLNDMKNGISAVSSPALQLLSLNQPGNDRFSIITIDIGLIRSIPKFPYR